MWYILDENNNPVEADIATYIEWEEEHHLKSIVKQENFDGMFVSTVFLGLNHGLYSGELHLWETMIFDINDEGYYQERYSSYQDALEGHQKALDSLKVELI